MAEMMAGLNLVLLGKTGAGKSSAGNTILGREAFVSQKSPTSVTQDVAVESGTVCGFPVTVYDTPGFCHPELRDEEIQRKCHSVLQRCESGLCVFLLVINADRFTQEERKTVEKIEELLGEKRMMKTWILFTRGDQLEENNMTIEEFINDNQLLKKLVQKYDGRYHVLNNKTKAHTAQVQELLSKVLQTWLHTMVTGATRQTLKATLADSLSLRRIVLLGNTDIGKSAAGNTILGQKVFRSEKSSSSVTCECSDAHGTVSGRSVSVVDTPGFFDTQMKHEEFMTEIARSVYLSSPGPHAFLIVFRVDDRFTEQEQQILQMIEMVFGQEVLKYSIILFTHGDLLDGESVEELIEDSSRLRDLVDQCGGRFHIFNNRDENNREQVNDLLKKIDMMIEQNGGHFSNQMFEDAQRIRREEEERRLREIEKRRQREIEERRQREIEEQRQREIEERRQREIEERRQREIEQRRQREIEERRQRAIEERIQREIEERIQREIEERRQREIEERRQREIEERRQREEEQRKQHEKQRQDEIERERERKEMEERIRAEKETSSGFKRVLVAVGAVTGAIIAGSAAAAAADDAAVAAAARADARAAAAAAGSAARAAASAAAAAAAGSASAAAAARAAASAAFGAFGAVGAVGAFGAVTAAAVAAAVAAVGFAVSAVAAANAAAADAAAAGAAAAGAAADAAKADAAAAVVAAVVILVVVVAAAVGVDKYIAKKK